jgi:hypothetical protein
MSASWDGTKWTDKSVPLPAYGLDGSLTAVSCPSATFCVPIGQYYPQDNPVLPNNLPISLFWNGTTWTSKAVPAPFGLSHLKVSQMGPISCSSATHCVAVGTQYSGPSLYRTYWHTRTSSTATARAGQSRLFR